MSSVELPVGTVTFLFTDIEGSTQLLKRLGGGRYSEALAAYLFDAGQRVSVVNAARIAAYADSRLQRAKTDRSDARLIGWFCARERPEPWMPPSPAERLLLALVRDLRDVQAIYRMEANRLLSAHAQVQPRIERHLAFLDAEIERLKHGHRRSHRPQRHPARAARSA